MDKHIEEETFVDLLEKFPHIWDKKHLMHKDKLALENAWLSISIIMEINGKQFSFYVIHN